MQFNLLKDPNNNWKYIAIVVILTFLVGSGILFYQYWWPPKQEIQKSLRGKEKED